MVIMMKSHRDCDDEIVLSVRNGGTRMFLIYLFRLSTIYFQGMVLIPKLNACFCLVSLRTGGVTIIIIIIIILIMITSIILIDIISAAYTSFLSILEHHVI